MPTTKMPASQNVYQIKVTLRGTKPPIWRRLLVPADLTLARLHEVLQTAMGWQDCHMHAFYVGQKRFGIPDPNDGLLGMPTINERTARLSTVLKGLGAKAEYTYDFGDSWEHAIVVEKVLPLEPDRRYPVCVAGKLQGPPEDCGGIPGFYNLLEAISDPAHEEHDELSEWLGEDYDPEAFSAEEINQRLFPLQRLK